MTVASGFIAFAGGVLTVSSASYATALGEYSISDTDCSFTSGFCAKSAGDAAETHAAGMLSNIGDAQFARYVLRVQTSDDTWHKLYLDGSSSELVVENDQLLALMITITGRRDLSAEGASFKRMVVVSATNDTPVIVGEEVVGVDYNPGSNYFVDFIADTVGNVLSIYVKHSDGASNKDVLWVADVKSIELVGSIITSASPSPSPSISISPSPSISQFSASPSFSTSISLSPSPSISFSPSIFLSPSISVSPSLSISPPISPSSFNLGNSGAQLDIVAPDTCDVTGTHVSHFPPIDGVTFGFNGTHILVDYMYGVVNHWRNEAQQMQTYTTHIDHIHTDLYDFNMDGYYDFATQTLKMTIAYTRYPDYANWIVSAIWIYEKSSVTYSDMTSGSPITLTKVSETSDCYTYGDPFPGQPACTPPDCGMPATIDFTRIPDPSPSLSPSPSHSPLSPSLSVSISSFPADTNALWRIAGFSYGGAAPECTQCSNLNATHVMSEDNSYSNAYGWRATLTPVCQSPATFGAVFTAVYYPGEEKIHVTGMLSRSGPVYEVYHWESVGVSLDDLLGGEISVPLIYSEHNHVCATDAALNPGYFTLMMPSPSLSTSISPSPSISYSPSTSISYSPSISPSPSISRFSVSISNSPSSSIAPVDCGFNQMQLTIGGAFSGAAVCCDDVLGVKTLYHTKTDIYGTVYFELEEPIGACGIATYTVLFNSDWAGLGQYLGGSVSIDSGIVFDFYKLGVIYCSDIDSGISSWDEINIRSSSCTSGGASFTGATVAVQGSP